MRYCIVSARYAAVQLMIAVVVVMTGTERAPVVVMMPGVAVMPIPVMCPTVVNVPPARVVTPVPRTMPCVPIGTPEPIVYDRTVNVNRLDDVVGAVNILVAYYLNSHLVFLVFLNVDRGYVLENILGKYSLQNDEAFVAFACLYYTQVIHLAIPVEVEVTEGAVGVVEHRLELLQVLSLCEQFSYNLQVQSF